MLTASGIPVPSVSGIPITTQQLSSALLRPPQHPPDHVAPASAVSMPRSSEQQATLTRGCNKGTSAYNSSSLDVYSPGIPLQQASCTRGCTDSSPAYSNSMLDIYLVVTARGQPNFRDARMPLPSNCDFHEWSATAHTQADQEVLQYLKYGFPAGFQGPIPTPSFGNLFSCQSSPRCPRLHNH